MATYKVNTPVKGYTGVRAGVMFADGAAQVDDSTPRARSQLAYFRRHGYKVEQKKTQRAAAKEAEPAKDADTGQSGGGAGGEGDPDGGSAGGAKTKGESGSGQKTGGGGKNAAASGKSGGK